MPSASDICSSWSVVADKQAGEVGYPVGLAVLTVDKEEDREKRAGVPDPIVKRFGVV